MADKIITLTQMNKWLDDLDTSLKDRIVASTLGDQVGREQTYNLYQASQLLRARMLGDFTDEVEFEHNQYDNEG